VFADDVKHFTNKHQLLRGNTQILGYVVAPLLLFGRDIAVGTFADFVQLGFDFAQACL